MNPVFGNLRIVGLLGGIASGKSFVADAFVRRGARLLDADKAGHAVLLEPEIEAAARKRWGDAIFGENGHIHRPALGRIVFAPPPYGPVELAYLESLVHPRIGIRLREQLSEIADEGVTQLVVLDAPVMLKAGWNRLCTALVYVDASQETRRERALRRGWTDEEFMRRESAQEPLDFKRKLADFVIDNSGPPSAVEAQIDRLWPQLTGTG